MTLDSKLKKEFFRTSGNENRYFQPISKRRQLLQELWLGREACIKSCDWSGQPAARVVIGQGSLQQELWLVRAAFSKSCDWSGQPAARFAIGQGSLQQELWLVCSKSCDWSGQPASCLYFPPQAEKPALLVSHTWHNKEMLKKQKRIRSIEWLGFLIKTGSDTG